MSAGVSSSGSRLRGDRQPSGVLLGLPTIVVADENWAGDALCAQTDPETFYPEKGGSTREAKRICRLCAVRAQCLEWALDHDERFGIWGGCSRKERLRLQRRIDAGLGCAQRRQLLAEYIGEQSSDRRLAG